LILTDDASSVVAEHMQNVSAASIEDLRKIYARNGAAENTIYEQAYVHRRWCERSCNVH
jgi:hypothetical protein